MSYMVSSLNFDSFHFRKHFARRLSKGFLQGLQFVDGFSVESIAIEKMKTDKKSSHRGANEGIIKTDAYMVIRVKQVLHLEISHLCPNVLLRPNCRIFRHLAFKN